MFASLLLLAAAQQIVIPLDRPRQIEKPAPPVRIHGNTYLVGTCGIASILITDPAGDILIDGGTENDAELIAANVRKLGFRVTDVKYLLLSHEHFDHAGGLAKLQRMSGAQLAASFGQAEVLKKGVPAQDDPQSGVLKPLPAARVDRIVQNGEMIRVGNSAVTASATPGHTSGALTWHWGSCDAGVCRQIVYADSLTPVSAPAYRFTEHPLYTSVFRHSIETVAKLDCDILLTPHPGASGMPDRLALGRPLLDSNACRDYAASLTRQLDDRLAKEKPKGRK